MNDVRALLKEIYVFKNFSDDQLDALATIAQEQTFSPADYVMKENDEADAMYVIQYGSLSMTKRSSQGDDQEFGQLGSGNHFGELPFVDTMNRALSVQALEKSMLLKISYSDLTKLLNSDPKLAADFYKEIAHFLAARLRKITVDLTFAREKNLKHF